MDISITFILVGSSLVLVALALDYWGVRHTKQSLPWWLARLVGNAALIFSIGVGSILIQNRAQSASPFWPILAAAIGLVLSQLIFRMVPKRTQ